MINLLKKRGLFLAGFLLLTILVVGCQATPETITEIITQVVTEIVTEEGEQVEVTRVVTEEVVVTATPEPMAEVTFTDPSPDTYVVQTFGDPNTLDPNLDYETAGGQIIQLVYETLITYNKDNPNEFVPLLAEEVPTTENGGISEDGLTYTFNIREGVTFSDGSEMTASDAAYTFQRGLLQSDPNGPQWLLLEPILGYDACHDITEAIDPEECSLAGDREALISTATPEQLVATCELVKSAVVGDDAAGTLTFTLSQPWGPFISTLAGFWGSVMDMDWAIANGAWDGDCATWQNYYSPGAEGSELTAIAMGTGPYVLDHWTPGEEQVLVANANYWRDFPRWEGDFTGPPAIETVVISLVDEWGTRFASLQAGDAESVTVPPANRPQVDEFVGEFCNFNTETSAFECTASETAADAPLRKWGNLPSVSRTDMFMNFNIQVDEDGNNQYIGSGELDGNGIPPDFFTDVHVRKAMNYCFDYDAYIAEALNGEGTRNNGPIILGMLGYNPDGPMYEFDLEACGAELEQAWGGVLPETGFRFQAEYNQGNTTRQAVAEILQDGLSQVNELYQVEVIGLPWPTHLRVFAAGLLPVTVSGWIEDIHDPHNWVQPYAVGTFAGRQRMPDDLKAAFLDIVNRGVATADPAEREAVYFEFQQFWYDNPPAVILAQALGARYEQRWVNGWFYNPISAGTPFDSLSLE
jgi:peptide/nickel transport system substrate-binding protein